MADFKQAADIALRNEDYNLSGVVTPDPTRADPKAIARFGINSAAHPKAVADGFFEMSHDAALQYAEDIIKYDYFAPLNGYNIREQSIANKLTDLAVNCGTDRAARVAQIAVNSVLKAGQNAVTVDGKIGPKTTDAINASDGAVLLEAIKAQGRRYYALVVEANTEDAKFENGWLARVNR